MASHLGFSIFEILQEILLQTVKDTVHHFICQNYDILKKKYINNYKYLIFFIQKFESLGMLNGVLIGILVPVGVLSIFG